MQGTYDIPMIRHHRAPEPPPIFSTFHYARDIILFATSWKNFLLSCGPCNTSKLDQPSRVQLRAWRAGIDLDANEDVSYTELRSTHIDWPDKIPESCRLVNYRMEYLPAGGGVWTIVPQAQAEDLANVVVRTSIPTGEVFADLPGLAVAGVSVRVHVEASKNELEGDFSLKPTDFRSP